MPYLPRRLLFSLNYMGKACAFGLRPIKISMAFWSQHKSRHYITAMANATLSRPDVMPVRFSSSKWPYPDLCEDELEESFVRGHGPGGQSVNKTTNCVLLKHLPTGVVIKCHESRSVEKNRELARLRLQVKLDWHYNRENSIKAIEKAETSKRRLQKKLKTNDRLAKLKAFKEREGID